MCGCAYITNIAMDNDLLMNDLHFTYEKMWLAVPASLLEGNTSQFHSNAKQSHQNSARRGQLRTNILVLFTFLVIFADYDISRCCFFPVTSVGASKKTSSTKRMRRPRSRRGWASGRFCCRDPVPKNGTDTVMTWNFLTCSWGLERSKKYI